MRAPVVFPAMGTPPLLLPRGRVPSLPTHDRSGFRPFPVLCPGAPHCCPTLICSACSVPRGPAAHNRPSPSFPRTCRHRAGKIQGKVDVQVGTTHIHKFSRLSGRHRGSAARKRTCSVTLLAVHAACEHEAGDDGSFQARHRRRLPRCAAVPVWITHIVTSLSTPHHS
jgi:hypothetical protein